MFKQNLIELSEMKRENVDGKRLYLTPEGKKYPSVTTITGLSKAQAIKEWRQRVGAEEANRVTAKASGLGTRVHKLCEHYVSNIELDYKKIKPMELFMFKQLKPILDTYLQEVLAVEAPLYSNFLEAAGTVDLIGNFYGKRCIIDFKTSKKKKPRSYITNYFMQEAAYAVMFEERTGIPINYLVTLIAVQEDEPQMFVEKRDDHIGTFMEYRHLYKEKYGV